jgi:hypothetical protein
MDEEVVVQSEDSDDIPDYPLSYTGAEVDSAIAKAHRMKMGKIKLTASFGATSGLYHAEISADLSAYKNPICVATLSGDFAREAGVIVSVSSGGVQFNVPTGDTAQKTRYVHYLIMEGDSLFLRRLFLQ